MAVRVLFDGVNIASDVLWSDVDLRTSAQGTASPGVMSVRDLGQSAREFPTGKRVSFDLGPGTDPFWAGYMVRAQRRYFFDVDFPETTQRKWVLALVDNNVLFTKRVVYKQSNPADINGPVYLPDPWDDDVIEDLVSDWLDLSTDGIDTTTRVQRVAKTSSGQNFYPWNGGQYWGEAMATITRLPASIFYLDPSYRLVNADVDDEDAPALLTDRPDEDGGASYRKMTYWEVGDQLANDVFGWGFGKGDDQGVFKRVQDTASIDAHLRWQEGMVAYDIWKQTTIDRFVDAYINGSPSSKRGHKNDGIRIELETDYPGFRVGQRPRFINHEYGLDLIIPVRSDHITFPVPGTPRHELLLSHEIDQPWTFADPIPIPKFPIPEIGCPPGVDCEPCWDCPQPCDECDCIDTGEDDGCVDNILTYEIDLFGRTALPGSVTNWGNATNGDTWTRWTSGDDTVGIDGSSGTVTLVGFSSPGSSQHGENIFVTLPPNAHRWQVDFKASDIPDNSAGGGFGTYRPLRITWGVEFEGGVFAEFGVRVSSNPGSFNSGQVFVGAGLSASPVSKTDWVADAWYTLVLEYFGDGTFGVKIWLRDSESEPEFYLLGGTDSAHAAWDGFVQCLIEQLDNRDGEPEITASFDNLIAMAECVSESGDCITEETFDRTVAAGWGLSEIDDLTWGTSLTSDFSVTPGDAAFAGATAFRTATLQLPDGGRTEPFEVLFELTIPSGSNGYVTTLALEGLGLSSYADLDIIRESGGTLEMYGYGQSEDSTSDDDDIVGQLSGYAGNSISVRVLLSGTTVSFTWWLTSGSEPGTPSMVLSLGVVAAPRAINLYFSNNNSPVTFHRMQIVEGYSCGTYSAGTPVVAYGVNDASVNHSGDSDYGSTSSFWVAFAGYNGTASPPYSIYSKQVVGPGSAVSGVTVQNFGGSIINDQITFLVVSGTTLKRFKVDFDPTYGRNAPGDPLVGVGLFGNLGKPLPGTQLSPISSSVNLLDNLDPVDVVAAGEWIDMRGAGPMYITPWPMDLVKPDWLGAGFDMYWANPQNAGAEPTAYSPTKPAPPYGDPLSRRYDGSTTYEPFIITYEDTTGATWVESSGGDCDCVPTSNPCEGSGVSGAAQRLSEDSYIGSPYEPGTSWVTINGVTQVRGTDYEETSPESGTVTFYSPVDESAVVYIRQTAPTTPPTSTAKRSCVINVPAGGDIQAALDAATGGTLANPRVVCLAGPSATYTIPDALFFNSKSYVYLQAEGSTIKVPLSPGAVTGGTWGGTQEIITLLNSDHCGIRDARIVGSHDAPGTYYLDGREFQAGVALKGSTDIVLERVITANNMGDCIGIYQDSVGVLILNCEGYGNGRMGVAVTQGQVVEVDGFRGSDQAWYWYEVEPDVGGHVEDVTFKNGIFWGRGLHLFGVNIIGGNDGIRCIDNLVKAGANRGIWSTVSEPKNGARNSNIVFSRNVGEVTFYEDVGWPNGPGVLLVKDVDGITIEDNYQAVQSGTNMAGILEQGTNTGLSQSGNDFPGATDIIR